MTAKTLRVATYNTRHCRGADDIVDVTRTAAAILATGAQVVALQELDRHVKRSDRVDQPTALSRLTGLSVAFAPTLHLQGGEFGIALVTERPIDHRFEPLPTFGTDRQHGVILAQYAGVNILATHLSRDRATRSAEMTQLGTMTSALRGPSVILGDLNEAPSGLQAVHRRPFWRTEALRPTHPSWLPVRQIDHIVPGHAVGLDGLWTIPSLASDHLPLVGILRIEGHEG